MPFMHSRAAVTRTLEYLQKGDIILNKNIKILLFAFNYDKKNPLMFPNHTGLYNFVFWNVPQIQYKNEDVQIVTFNYLTPSPWIQAFFDNDKRVLIDCENRNRDDIQAHVKTILGRPRFQIDNEKEDTEHLSRNAGYFGPKCDRHCICTLPGQVHCPGWTPLPLHMTGKGKKKLLDAQES